MSMQSEDAHTTWPCHLQQRLGRGFPSSNCKWRCWCTPDRIRPHSIWILSPGRLQVRWLWALQTTIYKLPWLRKCIEKPDSNLSCFICSCRVLCRYRTLPIGSNENSARLRTNVCLRSLQRVWKDCPTRRSRRLLFRIRPYSIQTVSAKPNNAQMPREYQVLAETLSEEFLIRWRNSSFTKKCRNWSTRKSTNRRRRIGWPRS